MIAIGADTQAIERVQSVRTYTLDAIPRWLDRTSTPRMRYVVCTAQRRTKRSAFRLAEIRDRLPASATVLIIDLCIKSKSDGAELAKLLATRGPGLPVAYWRPGH